MIRMLLTLLSAVFLVSPAAAQLSIQSATPGTGANCRVITLQVRYTQTPAAASVTTLSTANVQVREGQNVRTPSEVVFVPNTGLYRVVYTSSATGGTVQMVVEVFVPGFPGNIVVASSPTDSATLSCGPPMEVVSGEYLCASGQVRLGVRVNNATVLYPQNAFQVFEPGSTQNRPITGFELPATVTGTYFITYTSSQTANFTVEVRMPGEIPLSATRPITVSCPNPVSLTGTYDCPSSQVTLSVTLNPPPPTVLGNGAFAVSDNGGQFIPAVMPQLPSSPGGPYRLIYTPSPRTANFPVAVRVTIGSFVHTQNATVSVQCSTSLTVTGSFNCATRVVTLSVTMNPAPASPLANTAFTIREGSAAPFSPATAVPGSGGAYTLTYNSSQQANFLVSVSTASGNLSYSGSANIAYPCVSDVTFTASRNCNTGLVTASVTLNPAPSSPPTLQLRENGSPVQAQVNTGSPGNYTLTYTSQNQQGFTLELSVTAAGAAPITRQQTIAGCAVSGSVTGNATCVAPRTATLLVTVSPAPTVPIGSARISENGAAAFPVTSISNQGGGTYQINYTTTQTITYNASVRLVPTNSELQDIGPFSGQVNQNCQLTLSIQEAVPDCAQNRVTVTFVVSGPQVTQSAFPAPSQLAFTENGDPIANANILASDLIAAEAGRATYRLVFRPRTVTAPQFTLGVRTSFGGQNLEDSRQVASCQSPPPVPSCGTAPATVTVNQPFSFTPTVTGGIQPYQWRYSPQQSDAAPVVNGTTGQTTVTFTQTGSRRITLEVTDGANRTASTTCTFNVIAGTAPLDVTCGELTTRTGTVGQLYQASPTTAGGVGTQRTWSIANAGPFSINAATGLVSGTPTQANTFNVTVTVRDQATPTPNTASRTCGIVVQAALPPPPVANCGTIANSTATIGQTYGSMAAVNPNTGVSPFTWRFAANSNPPAWLTLTPATGRIAGTPPPNTATGATSVRLEVTDSASPARTSAPITCSFNVQQPAPFSITLNLQPATSPTGNATVTVTPGSGSAAALRGRLQLTFTPAPNTNVQATETPNPSFVAGLATDRRLLDFNIPAGSMAPQSFPVQQGTVAGSAEIRIVSLVNATTNAAVPVSNATVQTFTVAPSRPVIASGGVSLETTAPAGCRVVAGSVYVYVKSAFSTPRQITGGTVTFSLVPGRTAEGSLEVDLGSTPDFTSQFQNWFISPPGKQGGSVFGFCLPVTLTNGGIGDIQNVTVRLRNNASPGESEPVSWR